MGLHELRLRNFRLFDELTFKPDIEAITVLLSPNGTGKTSVLEAVYTLATASSFRTGAASDLIRAGRARVRSMACSSSANGASRSI